MKNIFKLMLATLSFYFVSCDKVDVLPFYGAGSNPVLTASSATLAPPASDSNANVLTLSWTSAKHATDSAKVKYVIEIDSTGKAFARSKTIEVIGAMSKTFTGKEINSIILSFGYAFNVPVDLDVKVTSSYNNNNERLASNVVKIRYTPYKIPPKIPVPASGKLFIVGGATPGAWNNPVPTPSQEMARIDETTFGAIIQLTANESYLFLPVNGSWSAKYGFNGAGNGNNVNGDELKAEGADVKAPATSGLYKITVDFQSGKFTVVPFTDQHGLPTELYIVGDATPGQWNNPVPVPSQKFTRLNAVQFELPSLAMTTAKNYLFLPENGSWSKKFGAVNNTTPGIKLGGPFKPEGADIPSPDVSGNYKITVDFYRSTYTLVKL